MGVGFLQNIIGTLVYISAQFLGMFAASAMSYWVYSTNENDAYNKMSSKGQGFADDFVFSCLYSTCPTDQPNSKV